MIRIVCLFITMATAFAGLALTSSAHADPVAVVAEYYSASRVAAINNNDGTAFTFDSYVPNNGVNNGVIAEYNSPFTGFIDPADDITEPAVGVVISESDGLVTFTDMTSGRVTSDIYGNTDGASLSIGFFDPEDITTPAAVSCLGLRIGRPPLNSVTAQLYDVDNNLLGSFVIPNVAYDTAEVAWVCMDGLEEVAAIHRVTITNTSDSCWMLGSWVDNPDYEDMYFTNFTLVPEPSTSLLMLAGICGLIKRKRQ